MNHKITCYQIFDPGGQEPVIKGGEVITKIESRTQVSDLMRILQSSGEVPQLVQFEFLVFRPAPRRIGWFELLCPSIEACNMLPSKNLEKAFEVRPLPTTTSCPPLQAAPPPKTFRKLGKEIISSHPTLPARDTGTSRYACVGQSCLQTLGKTHKQSPGSGNILTP